jgi:hypothetical protein
MMRSEWTWTARSTSFQFEPNQPAIIGSWFTTYDQTLSETFPQGYLWDSDHTGQDLVIVPHA